MAKIMTFCLLACLWIGVMAAGEVACNGRGMLDYDGKCVCNPGYTGDTCESCVEESAGVVCMKEYCDICHKESPPDVCADIKTKFCQCLPGYQPMVNGVCLPGCTEGSCTGDHQQCNSTAYMCECEDGYEMNDGECEKACPGGCGEHGVCVDGECFCKSGYYGGNCEVPPVCSGSYDDWSCGEHGYCTDGYQCVCSDGYTGTSCTVKPSCADRCLHGTCRREWDEDERCTNCVDGYTGSWCEVPPVCSGFDDHWSCGEHGYCSDYQCECSDGYTGEKCADELGCGDKGTCGEHGYCNDYQCVCFNGYTGSNCTVLCNGHGKLEGYKCACTDRYSGDKCENAPVCWGPDDDWSCLIHEYCNDEYQCVCQDGFIGPNCTERVSIIGGDDSKYYANMFYVLIGGLGAMIIIALVVVFLWKDCGNKNAYKFFTGSDTSKQDAICSTSGDVSPQEVAPANDSTVKADIEGLE